MSSRAEIEKKVVIIGGGFYGVCIACYLVERRGIKDVVLIEREGDILQRASYTNQARVHNGYHYPRSFTTAYRSRINLPRFVKDWPEAVVSDFTKLYAIARKNSKVTARQFERFCKEIGADLKDAKAFKSLFNLDLIEQVYEVKEFAFNSQKLAGWGRGQLAKLGVSLMTESRVEVINSSNGDNLYEVSGSTGVNGKKFSLNADYVFNCTYSGINSIVGEFSGISSGLKHEITEMALLQMPDTLKGIGVTVMDGPFFSFMPFPARQLHTLSHVRYTPHHAWFDDKFLNPYQALDLYKKGTRVDRMIRDVARYVPSIIQAEHKESLFEVKTVLVKNEGDDGRPILFEKHHELKNIYSILGGKIDNIYDILEKLDDEFL